MAYQEVDMWEVLEVLRRAARGESITQIKQATGRSRKTVRRYVRLARKLGWAGDQEPTEDLAGAVQRRLKPVPEESTPGVAESRLWPHRERIRLWLEGYGHERGLRLTKVHLLLNRGASPLQFVAPLGSNRQAPGRQRRGRPRLSV